jgi:AraC-like DNA-binding protein
MTARPPILPVRPVDPLSDVLRAVRLTGSLFFLIENVTTKAPARMADGATIAKALSPTTQTVISYHVVTRGLAFAARYGAPPVKLDTGDIVIFPHGDPYWLAPTPTPAPPVIPEEAVGFLQYAKSMGMCLGPPPIDPDYGAVDDDLAASFICGYLGCDLAPYNPLLSSLPRVLVVRPSPNGKDALDRILALTLEEARAQNPGGETMRTRLAELLFLEAVRRHLATFDVDREGWLAGVRDEHVGRALSLLHADIARAWTLPELAKMSGSSRTVLAERFARLVGQPPMQYLARWRMQVAAQRLRDGTEKVASVALAVGYDSEAAFSRAFKKIAGMSPADFRSS